MGQKVHPKGIRIGVNRTWDSKWYANKRNFAKFFLQDTEIRKAINAKIVDAGVARIEIERSIKNVIINIYTSKPGVIIGRQGAAIDQLKEDLERKFNERFEINIKEIKKPDLEAELVADSIARQIEKRVAYRRAAKMAIQRAMESGAKGVKVFLGGRLNGVEIARSEMFTEGKIPTQTLRADISYAIERANTTYGVIGVKVWIYRGEIFDNQEHSAPSQK